MSTEQDNQDADGAAEPRRRRGIYLLPNLFTTAALFFGFYAIVAAMNGNFRLASIGIFVAMLMDGLDGRVARMTHTQSDFGKEYDSLSDMISFGLAPALVVYSWALSGMSQYGWYWAKVGWLGAFVYAAGGALRLARFNTQAERQDRRYFQGLPSPSAAAVIAGMVWVCREAGISGHDFGFPALILTVIAGLLMVSNFRYHSFKHINLNERVPFRYILAVVLVFILIAINPAQVLFGVFFLYLCSGPVLAGMRRLRGGPRGRGR
ncbi:MAG TPA: CDP-diacylglycerol--serine O-phosphatidyltransferase [Gammaproteobacteria bacterium]|nr:CDP-diacylglycerol--serine O-phosphatidyltransferase [Gammaproteobacteria bacterium]